MAKHVELSTPLTSNVWHKGLGAELASDTGAVFAIAEPMPHTDGETGFSPASPHAVTDGEFYPLGGMAYWDIVEEVTGDMLHRTVRVHIRQQVWGPMDIGMYSPCRGKRLLLCRNSANRRPVDGYLFTVVGGSTTLLPGDNGLRERRIDWQCRVLQIELDEVLRLMDYSSSGDLNLAVTAGAPLPEA